jgi:hypothetical protein
MICRPLTRPSANQSLPYCSIFCSHELQIPYKGVTRLSRFSPDRIPNFKPSQGPPIDASLSLFWKPIYRENARDKILTRARDLGQEISACACKAPPVANHFRHPAIDSLLDHFLQGTAAGEGAVTTAVRQR